MYEPVCVFGRMETQVALLRACWTELFVLGMAQCSQNLSLPSILSSIINHLHNSVAQDKISAHRVKLVRSQVRGAECLAILDLAKFK